MLCKRNSARLKVFLEKNIIDGCITLNYFLKTGINKERSNFDRKFKLSRAPANTHQCTSLSWNNIFLFLGKARITL